MKLQTMATYEGQPVTKRNRTTHKWDSEQKLKYSKTDIIYNDRQQIWSYDIPKENRTAAIANDRVSNEIAEILQSFRSEANSSGRGHPRSPSADQPMPGPHLRKSPTYDAPQWTESSHDFEEMDDELPKTTDTDWTIPQRKQDSQGRGYYWSGKMNGNRKIWTEKYPATWPSRECSEEEAREEMGGTFPFGDESFDKGNNAFSEYETVCEDESFGEDTEQCADTIDI